jgi:hypothetical protein
MTTDVLDQPTPEFREYLEGEIAREYRRHRSFARLRATAVIVASLAAGTTAGLASAQIREGAQRESLLEVALSDMALAGLRLELARARVTDASTKLKAGLISPASLGEAESELRGMEAHAMRAKLNVDEIRATSLPPRDELNAPLVGGRDFVTERIQLDLFLRQQQLTAAEQTQTETERQVRVGSASDMALLDAGLAVTRARAALGTLAERRKLRKEFVDRGTPGEQLTRRFQQAQVRHEAFVAQEALKVLRQRLDAVRRQHGVGAASDLDLLRAQIELREQELELQLLTRQLRELAKAVGS